MLPSSTGADLISPERALIHSRQCGHQLPPCLAACSRQAGASAAFDAAVQKQVLWIARRIDQALNMPAIGEHESAALAVDPGRIVAALPRRDVITQPRDDVAVEIHLRHVERRAARY